ncbi:MAG: hypothetical protein AB1715_02605, partial [Acidobacteriota bacterium]
MKDNRFSVGFCRRTIFMGCLTFWVLVVFLAVPNIGQEAKKKKALFVWGGWEDHEPKQCVDIFAP